MKKEERVVHTVPQSVRPYRDGDDVDAVVDLLADAFIDGPVAAWLDPQVQTRRVHARVYFADIVADTLSGGEVHLATRMRPAYSSGEGFEVIGAALWHRCPRPAGPATTDTGGAGNSGIPGAVMRRMVALDELLISRHPGHAHHHLAYLGVRPDAQNHGVGSSLLAYQHAVLDSAEVSSYLEANQPDNRRLYWRRGYSDHGPAVLLPDGTPIWPMWRDPQDTSC